MNVRTRRMPPLSLVIATLACSSPSEPPSGALELAFVRRSQIFSVRVR